MKKLIIPCTSPTLRVLFTRLSLETQNYLWCILSSGIKSFYWVHVPNINRITISVLLIVFFSIRFWINQTTGLIYTKSFLDREKQSVYHLTVEARDGGEKVSSASVKVDIIDVNDNRPIFMQPKYEFGITENSTLMSGMDSISVHVSYQLFTKKKWIKSEISNVGLFVNDLQEHKNMICMKQYLT